MGTTTSRRRMPSKEKVAEFWGFTLDCCWRCDVSYPILDRAHIVDRCYWREDAHLLDIEENLFMLCRPCHSIQPSFRVDEYVSALAWMCLDAKVYSDIFRDDPRLMALRAKDPEMADRAFDTVVGLLQSRWDSGLTSRGYHTLF